jgi:hypothetical protein
VSCFQCDCDIPHVCYEGVRDARWGWTDEAVAALEGAQRQGFLGGTPRAPGFVMSKESLHAARRAPSKKRSRS